MNRNDSFTGPDAGQGHHAIRKLWPHERDLYIAHLIRLDRQSRVDRFGMLMSDEALRHYADDSFWIGGIVHAYVEDGLVRAAGELQGLLEFPRTSAEAAFSVEEGWRQRGIGGQLFEAIRLSAKNRNLAALEIICHPGNRAMLALARRHGMQIVMEEGEVHGRARLDLRSASSLFDEAMGDASAAVSSIIDLQRNLSGH